MFRCFTLDCITPYGNNTPAQMLNSFENLFSHDFQPVVFVSFCFLSYCYLLGFESILEGIYGQLLLRDLNLFDGKLVFVLRNCVD